MLSYFILYFFFILFVIFFIPFLSFYVCVCLKNIAVRPTAREALFWGPSQRGGRRAATQGYYINICGAKTRYNKIFMDFLSLVFVFVVVIFIYNSTLLFIFVLLLNCAHSLQFTYFTFAFLKFP